MNSRCSHHTIVPSIPVVPHNILSEDWLHYSVNETDIGLSAYNCACTVQLFVMLCEHSKADFCFYNSMRLTAVSRRIMFSGRPSLLNWLDFGVHGWKVRVAVTSYQSHARISGMFRDNCFKVATISIWTQGWTDFGGQRSGSVWPVVCPALMNMIFPERIEGISSYLAQMCI